MAPTAPARIEPTAGEGPDAGEGAPPSSWRISGAWTLANLPELQQQVARHPWGSTPSTIPHLDWSALTALDTAGAACLIGWMGVDPLDAMLGAPHPTLGAEQAALLRAVGQALRTVAPPHAPRPSQAFSDLFEDVGRNVSGLWRNAVQLLGFIGLVLERLGANLFHPGRWRITSLVAQTEQVGLHAVPLVMLLTFLVGAVVAFLGATVLATFGANQYVVHLVAFSFLREFGVLLTAILMAGRTASAFTAQIGAMKTNEEIDALRTLGLDPIDLLVLPRLLAMVISMPILTFLAMLSGIVGGALVSVTSLGLSPNLFLSILQSDIAVRHFYVGMCKAPVFAALIALVGCLEGFKSSGSARSVGDHTTSAVVQSIFLVILFNALAALFFMHMNW